MSVPTGLPSLNLCTPAYTVPSERETCVEFSVQDTHRPAAVTGHVGFAKLETDCLAHVDDYYYGAYCRACKHSARLSLVKLRAHPWR
jgi:hypothetical protein